MTENMLTNNKKRMKIPKDVIRIRKSKKDRYCNCQKDKDRDKKTNKDLQNTRQKSKDRGIQPDQKPRVNSGAPER